MMAVPIHVGKFLVADEANAEHGMQHTPESGFTSWGSQGVVTTGTASTTHYRRMPDGQVLWLGD
jgi:hypothetical protein